MVPETILGRRPQSKGMSVSMWPAPEFPLWEKLSSKGPCAGRSGLDVQRVGDDELHCESILACFRAVGTQMTGFCEQRLTAEVKRV